VTIDQIQAAILDAIARRDELVKEAGSLYLAASEAEHAYRMAQAKAYLRVEGKNADERRAQVDQIVDREMRERNLSEAKAAGIKEALAAEKDKISAFQTLLRLQMTELDALRFGQHSG